MTQRQLLEENLKELQEQFVRHHALIKALAQGEQLEAECRFTSCRHHQQLLNLIAESVRVLDETRRAFKSKALEQLRLRLMQTLSEETSEALSLR